LHWRFAVLSLRARYNAPFRFDPGNCFVCYSFQRDCNGFRRSSRICQFAFTYRGNVIVSCPLSVGQKRKHRCDELSTTRWDCGRGSLRSKSDMQSSYNRHTFSESEHFAREYLDTSIASLGISCCACSTTQPVFYCAHLGRTTTSHSATSRDIDTSC
jgi:hypothetical protein